MIIIIIIIIIIITKPKSFISVFQISVYVYLILEDLLRNRNLYCQIKGLQSLFIRQYQQIHCFSISSEVLY